MNIYDTVIYNSPGVGSFRELVQLCRCAFSWGSPRKNMGFKYAPRNEVLSNIIEFLAASGLPDLSRTITMMAENGHAIIDVDDSWLRSREKSAEGYYASCDALFTCLPDIGLLAKPADCAVSLLAAPSPGGTVVGLVHTGFRGVDAGLPSRIVRHLSDKYLVDPAQIRIGIAPSVVSDNYYIRSSTELRRVETWRGFITERNDLFYLDTRGLLVRQYVIEGVPSSGIEMYDVDTYAAAASRESFSERYWRLHQDTINGRFVTAIAKHDAFR